VAAWRAGYCKLAAYEDIAIATARNGSQYFWAVKEKLDATKEYHVLSQLGGISLGEMSSSWLLTVLTSWQRAPTLTTFLGHCSCPAVFTVVCSSGQRYAAPLTNDGRVTASHMQRCAAGLFC
jgi:hypothetical protein